MYDHQRDVPLLLAGAAATDADIALGTAAVVAVAYAGLQPFKVTDLTAQVVTTFDTADTVLTVTRRPTPGSGTGAVTIGTLTIPNAAAAPNVYYKEFDPVTISPGEEIVISTDGGTTNGTAILRLGSRPAWEHPSNNSKLIASA
jgi:hypothetical protein